MNLQSCPEVLDRIELYLAGECTEPEQAALRAHLENCPACARVEQETRQVAALLDIRFGEPERLQRLFARIDAEGKRSRPWIIPFARRATAVAAMLVLAIGLSFSFRVWGPPAAPDQGPLAALAGRGLEPGPFLEKMPAMVRLMTRPPEHPLVYSLNLGGQSPVEFRARLKANDAKIPPPPLVNLHLELHNRTDREIRLFLGADRSELVLELSGPGVVKVPARKELGEAFLVPRTIRLAPGRSCSLPIHRLVFGKSGQTYGLYWTEPGDYTLTIRYRAAIAPAPPGVFRTMVPGHEKETIGLVVVQSAPIRIQVRAK